MVVAAVEQDYERMQEAPDPEYQLTVRRTYVRLLQGAIEIALLLQAAGYRATVSEADGDAMTIPYAISAGLGQLGMNGQLLTPQAGSRVRMMLVSTDAPLSLDAPADYGIPGVCQRCRICPVQRYGLEPVLDAYRRSGEILGRGGELETYRWPLDGRVYADGRRPRLDAETRRPAGLRAARRAEAG